MLPASPKVVYETLMSSTKHSAFTNGEAKISPKVGGAFTTFDGWATGKNIELEPGKLIVQTWRAEDWPTGHFSTVKFQLLPAPGGNTKLLFTQTDVPVAKAKDIARGWRDYYWAAMKTYLSEVK